MYFSSILSPYVYTITVLLFLAPLLILCIRRNTFKPLTFNKLTTTFNFTLIYYTVISIILLIVMKIVDVAIYEQSKGNDFTEIIMGTGYCYVVIGFFFYLPSVGFLNLINLVLRRFVKTNAN